MAAISKLRCMENGKAVLRIAYYNQKLRHKSRYSNQVQPTETTQKAISLLLQKVI